MNQINVNGVLYTPREQENEQKPKMPKQIGGLLGLAALFSGIAGGFDGYYPKQKRKERPNVDIAKEFALIQQKKSALSRASRDWVVHQFHLIYEIVKPEDNIVVPATHIDNGKTTLTERSLLKDAEEDGIIII